MLIKIMLALNSIAAVIFALALTHAITKFGGDKKQRITAIIFGSILVIFMVLNVIALIIK